MTTSIDQFRRHVTGLAGIYYRLDNGYIDGRNADATDGCMTGHFQKARAVLTAACLDNIDPLPEYLDSPRGKRLYEKWSALERRYLGLRP